MKVREPVARPLDVVAIELLLTASQAFLSGTLVYLAVGIWGDRGVGLGPTAVILALVGLAVGASWLYWLLGGTGWPMAASNTPAALFLGFALLLGWQGQGFVRLDALPLLLSLAAAIYGIVCGVFLESPRRWRWDQRQRLRPGTQVPRVSPTAKAMAAKVPRSLPRRDPSIPAAVEPPGIPDATSAAASGGPGSPYPNDAAGSSDPLSAPPDVMSAEADERPVGDALSPDSSAGDGKDEASSSDTTGVPPATVAARPDSPPRATDRLDRGRSKGPGLPEAEPTPGGIELPTSVEPRAQRSPWAWAAPPEWNRDEDDEPDGGSSSRS